MVSSESGSSAAAAPRRAAAAAAGGGGTLEPPPLSRASHPRSFKLLFAAQREPGRSDVSLVKPLGLPATVAGKFYARSEPTAAAEGAAEEAALQRVRRMFAAGPTDKYAHPALSSHEVGWWWSRARRQPAVLRHHVRDSPWLRERLRVLAADLPVKQR